MADVITRFKLETTQYDSKLRDATKGLKEVIHQTELAGNDFKEFSSRAIEAARALGQQATGATNAKDKVKELVSSYNEMAKTYNLMSDAMKKSEGGKALASSLEQLQQRIKDAKAEMNATPGILDNLASKFTVNIDAIKLFNIGLQAAEGALNVAKDAFFASEQNVDDWGRTVTSAEGIYDSFLQTLNNGDFSGFLSRISEVISKAQDAYNAIDELNTRMTIINPERTRLQSRATELKSIIRRHGADSEAGINAKKELLQIEGMLQQAFKTESQLNMNAFKAKVDQKLADAGIKLGKKDYDFLMRTFSSDASYMAMKRGASGAKGSDYIAGGSYDEGSVYKYDTRNMNQKLLDLFTDEWRKENSSLLNAAFSAKGAAASTMLSNSRYLKESGSGSAGSGGVNTIKEEKDDFEEIIGLIPNAEEAVRSLQHQISESWDEGEIAKLTEDLKIAQKELQRLKDIGSEKPMIKGLSGFNQQTVSAWMQGRQGDLSNAEYGSADYNSILGNIADMNTIKTILEQSVKAGIDAAQFDLSSFWEKVFDGEDIPDSTWQSMVDKINEKLKELNIDPIKIDFQTGEVAKEGEKTKKAWQAAASAVSSVGSALNNIEDPGVKIMGMVGQAIANIALGFAQASAKEGKGGIWYWIAATAAGLATMVATISSIHSATGYANGGIVKGNSYSGDNIYGGPDAMVNAGELVLTTAQQNSLAQHLQGGGMRNINVTGKLKGTDILLSVDRSAQATGRGQLMTWK